MPGTAVEATRQAVGGLLNVVQAAQDWGVRRLGVASTIGVYFAGADGGGPHAGGPLREDAAVADRARLMEPAFAGDGLDLNYVKDTGYRAAYGTERAAADCVAWLRAGHRR
ncbi:NAD(P)-dependent oxidoreductase [Streptomyces vinaceus]|uniref:NAD(P)-dependent oxidoreductase n=1 Tax=Streptomyces vinaceus TaxID=1960 RepID=UPI00167B5232|nr:NAD(P)-dependent oxidoreductase [Streptomyces vinaceus]GHE25250.1 hypothetical protein GCM10017778_01890 [Streptomyces vinaceus]